MKVTILTAIFGDYEDLKPALPQDGADATFICVSDMWKPGTVINGWRIAEHIGSHQSFRPVPADPNMAAKSPKMNPTDYTNDEASIWVDASFRIKSRDMAKDLIARAHPIAQFLHPDRDCIYQEAAFSASMQRYARLPLMDQIASYAGKHPQYWGLWAAGVIARVHTNPVLWMGRRWYKECETWGIQDQVSQAVALREEGIRPASLPGSLYSNKWLSFEPSPKHQETRQ